LVELGFAVEEHFDLDPIEAEDVENVLTPADLASFVVRQLTADDGDSDSPATS
jgi:acyl carrier protein